MVEGSERRRFFTSPFESQGKLRMTGGLEKLVVPNTLSFPPTSLPVIPASF